MNRLRHAVCGTAPKRDEGKPMPRDRWCVIEVSNANRVSYGFGPPYIGVHARHRYKEHAMAEIAAIRSRYDERTLLLLWDDERERWEEVEG